MSENAYKKAIAKNLDERPTPPEELWDLFAQIGREATLEARGMPSSVDEALAKLAAHPFIGSYDLREAGPIGVIFVDPSDEEDEEDNA